jgi:2-iminobutanoate/2-iminopropanoate deaminase
MRGLVLSPLLILAASLAATSIDRKVVSPQGSDVGLPFSPGILAGDFLDLSGHIGNVPGTLEVSGDVRAQTERALENLGAVLKAADMDFSHVVSSNVYLADSRDFQTMNEVYRGYFGKTPPTRATVQADIAIPNALVEIAMVAVRPGVDRRVITPEGWTSPQLPYSWGILAGDTVFISGVTSRNPQTYQPVPGDIALQTRQVLTNVGAILKAAELDYRDVTSCRVFLDDGRDFLTMNEVYRSFFPESPPARATVRATLMNPAFLVEIQCIASKGAERTVVADPAAQSGRPFSPAIQVGTRLYLAGAVGRGPQGFAPGDLKEQTRQTMENLRSTLAAAGMGFGNVTSSMVFLSDIRHFAAMNEVYGEFFPGAPPARATVGAQLMSPDALVEIVMTAAE